VVAALIANVLPYGLFAFAEQTVPSSLAGALNATTPLWTAIIAYAVGTDRPMTTGRIIGLGLGLLGALVVLSPWNVRQLTDARGLFACVAAAASYGLSYVYQSRYLANRGLSSLVLAAAQLTAATGLLAVTLPFTGRQPIHLTSAGLTAILVLGTLGTGLAYVINFALITSEGATSASVVTYLVPAVSVVLGIIVLTEPRHWSLLFGLILVLLGVALVRRPGWTRGHSDGA
jgi:drug/metabolite transporter (DMT)-like permease